MAFARLWFDERTVSSVFEPLVADWQREWQAGNRRSTVRLRGTAAFVLTAVRLAPPIVLAPLPPRLAGPLFGRVLGLSVVGVVCLLGLIAATWRDAGLPTSAWMLLLPGIFTVLLPFAIGIGVDAIRSHSAWSAHVQRRAVVRLLAVVTLWMIVGGGWVAPVTGQAWRYLMDAANAGQDVSPLTRVSGLTTPELFAATHPKVHPLIRLDDRRREMEFRALLILLPTLLACARWRVMEQEMGRWFVPRTAGTIVLWAVTILALLRLSQSPYGPTSFIRQHFLIWSYLVGLGTLVMFRRLESYRPAREAGAQ